MPTHTARSRQPATLADEMAYAALPEETREMIERLFGSGDDSADQDDYNAGYRDGERAAREKAHEEGYEEGYAAAISEASTAVASLAPAD